MKAGICNSDSSFPGGTVLAMFFYKKETIISEL
jgi:hypothetical protein